eukprot:406217-Lingulodinium_polyedra.AAC.1
MSVATRTKRSDSAQSDKANAAKAQHLLAGKCAAARALRPQSPAGVGDGPVLRSAPRPRRAP